MRKLICLCVASAALISSCSKDLHCEEDVPDLNEESRTVVFSPSMGLETDITPWTPDDGMRAVISRAALAECADSLMCMDYMSGTFVQGVSQPASNSFSIKMKYGSHSLFFVGHSAKKYYVDNDKGMMHQDKVSETFLKRMDFTVSDNTDAGCSVKMDRVVSKLTVLIQDAIPEYVKSLRLTVGNHLATLDLNTGMGVAEEEKEFVIAWDLSSEHIGMKGVKLSVFTFCKEGEFNVPIRLEAIDAQGNVKVNRTASSIPLKKNRCTVAKCRLFEQKGSFTFDAPGEWNPPLEMELEEEGK